MKLPLLSFEYTSHQCEEDLAFCKRVVHQGACINLYPLMLLQIMFQPHSKNCQVIEITTWKWAIDPSYFTIFYAKANLITNCSLILEFMAAPTLSLFEYAKINPINRQEAVIALITIFSTFKINLNTEIIDIKKC